MTYYNRKKVKPRMWFMPNVIPPRNVCPVPCWNTDTKRDGVVSGKHFRCRLAAAVSACVLNVFLSSLMSLTRRIAPKQPASVFFFSCWTDEESGAMNPVFRKVTLSVFSEVTQLRCYQESESPLRQVGPFIGRYCCLVRGCKAETFLI